VVPEAGEHRDQPAAGGDHVPAVVPQERQAGLDAPAVVVPEVPADHAEHRVLPGGLDVVRDRVAVHPAVAAGMKWTALVALAGMVRNAYVGELLPIRNLYSVSGVSPVSSAGRP
jgi:hypothetical protein